MSTILERISDALTPQRRAENHPAPVRRIAELALTEIKRDKALDGWLAGETNYRRILRQFNSLPDFPERAAHGRHVDERAAELIADKPKTAGRGRGKVSFEGEAQTERQALRAALTKLSAELAPQRRRVAEILLARLHQECATIMLAESKVAQSFGLAYQESPTLTALKSLSDYIVNRGFVIALELLN